MADLKRSSGSRGIQEATVEKIRIASAWLRDYVTAIKRGQMHPFTSMERRVREATRNEAWGPTGKQLNELAEASNNPVDCEIIFAVIQFRLGYPPEKWRNVYKALVLLDFLVQRGSEQSVQIAREDVSGRLADLERFAYSSAEGRDHGVNVRHRAKSIRELLQDPEYLQSTRQSHCKKRLTYQGYSRDQLVGSRSFHDDQDIPSSLATARSSSLRRTLSESSMQEPDAHGANQGLQTDANLSRNAGETKGVTMEMNKKQLAELRQLLELPENRYCADCVGGGGAARASWASINTGVFICLQCAGAHRGLGTHISKVRSCTLDTWLPDQVAFMAQTGNHRANEFYEARLEPSAKPIYASGDIASFIRRKYTDREFASDSVWPPTLIKEPSGSIPVDGQDGIERADPEARPRTRPSELSPKVTPARSGSQSMRQYSLANRLPTKLVSVPLPRHESSPPVDAKPAEPPIIDNLMEFDLADSPTAAAAPDMPNDVFADLATLEPALRALNSQVMQQDSGYGSYAMPFVRPIQDPQPQQPIQSWNHLSGQNGNIGSGLELADESGPGFADESVQDWGRPSERPEMVGTKQLPTPGKLRVRRPPPGSRARTQSHAAEDFPSASSTPMFTPRLSQLLGPGPSASGWQTPQARQAPVPYLPLGKSSNQPKANQSALEQSAKTWMANAQQGKSGSMDDLVLDAVAGLPPQPQGNLQRILATPPNPQPSLAQQRAAVMF